MPLAAAAGGVVGTEKVDAAALVVIVEHAAGFHGAGPVAVHQKNHGFAAGAAGVIISPQVLRPGRADGIFLVGHLAQAPGGLVPPLIVFVAVAPGVKHSIGFSYR